MGYSINKRVTILNKYCIPAPVVGGFLFMFLTWLGHISSNIISMKIDPPNSPVIVYPKNAAIGNMEFLNICFE